jgi:diguanylate cyclase (GGDEF)-like protein
MAISSQLSILIVDDNQVQRSIVCKMVLAYGQIGLIANGYEEALSHLEQNHIDLILMDIEMPDVNGFELTRIIRERHSKWIPIIFLSGNDSEKYLATGIDAGGDDYLTKPVKEVILNAKIRAMTRIATMQHDLDEANKKLEQLTCIDPLTQVLNRRGLEEVLDVAWGTYQREKSELSLLMIDLDHFKSYNDNYGHQQGDECLKRIANVLKMGINRTTDTVARYGGEEFIVVLPFTPLEGAKFKAQALLHAIKNENIVHEFSSVCDYVSVSIGITATSCSAHNLESLIKQSDVALYQAKKRGKNRSVVYKD